MNLDLLGSAAVTVRPSDRASASAGLRVRSDLKAGRDAYSRIYNPGYGVYIYST